MTAATAPHHTTPHHYIQTQLPLCACCEDGSVCWHDLHTGQNLSKMPNHPSMFTIRLSQPVTSPYRPIDPHPLPTRLPRRLSTSGAHYPAKASPVSKADQ
ncbi:hypothetical protein CEXT_342401 [Caerostris extrusa]|uniref:Uncharacterized protein n=1 Tax=Caerostris extrusa TaxID=172846 RepID=A0AAV4WE41_CAEEX|nr:hypothetical protein CEXT_342401 [Caerostris extrusa]